MLIIFIYYLPANSLDLYPMAGLPFVSKTPGKLYRQILKFMSWPHIVRYKKHKGIAHCKDVVNNITNFKNT